MFENKKNKWLIRSTSNESVWAQKMSNSIQGIKSAKLEIANLSKSVSTKNDSNDTYLAFSFLFSSVTLSY
jgi:hypothetical protein